MEEEENQEKNSKQSPKQTPSNTINDGEKSPRKKESVENVDTKKSGTPTRRESISGLEKDRSKPASARQSPDSSRATKTPSIERVKKTDSGNAAKLTSSGKNISTGVDQRRKSKSLKKPGESNKDDEAAAKRERKQSMRSPVPPSTDTQEAPQDPATETLPVRTSEPTTSERQSKASESTKQEDTPRQDKGSSEAMTVMSMESISSKPDPDEYGIPPENIVWEWEQELEEYDEPDVYPSEKDYIWVPTLVEATSDDEDGEEISPDGEQKKVEQPKEQTDGDEGKKESLPQSSVNDTVKQSEDVTPLRDSDVSGVTSDVPTRDSAEDIKASNISEINRGTDGGSGSNETPGESPQKSNEQKTETPEEENHDNQPEPETDVSTTVDTSAIQQNLTAESETVDAESEKTSAMAKELDTDGSHEQKETTQEQVVEGTDASEQQDTDNEQKEPKNKTDTNNEDDEDMTDKIDVEDDGKMKKDNIAADNTEEVENEAEDKENTMAVDEKENLENEDEVQKSTGAEEEEKTKSSDEEKTTKEKGEKKLKDRTVSTFEQIQVIESEDGADPVDDFEVPGLPEPEPETVEPPPKRYKTVLVKTLVPRPPKIHYVPEEERTTHICSDRHHFRKRPMILVMSYGYDCQRMANLHVLDRETIVYMSGFVLTFFNHSTGEQSYLRCISGSCFGALAIHPSKKLFAAAEKGDNPIVGIWSWPKQQLFRKLKDGTNRAFASVNFSPCGKFLATQGGEPDYLITVYNWLSEMPVVRVKSHAQDVYRVTFSKELAGRLTTSGLCHIKFWKMATTFTGLKLKGDLGRFGRTELSDIEGYIEMPDGKVLSGTEWGNLLLWENGLIVAEICVRHDIPCHEGIIRQVLHNEGEFYTAGQDGWIRTWNFDAIDQAEINTTEESLKVSVKSSGQVLVSEKADIWYIVQDLPDNSSSSVFWFAQDGKGTIMCIDLCFLNTARDPYPILTAHGGPIVACATSKINCIFASLGTDGQIRVFDYTSHELLACRTFTAAGTVLLWPGVHFDPYCCTLLVGFADGTFRVLTLSASKDEDDLLSMSLLLYQVRKPHSRRLTCMDIDSTGSYLATGGDDGTIFFFDIFDDYAPLVFLSMPDYKPVACLKWIKAESKEADEDGPSSKILAALEGGTLIEMMMPKLSEIDNKTTYHHLDAKFLRRVDFKSIKSELLHNEDMEMERLAEEQRNAATEIENRKRIEEGLETESQQNLRLLEEAEEIERIKAELGPSKKWEPYIPTTQSPVSLMIPSVIDSEEVFLIMDGYDKGYLYMMRFGDADKCKPDRENYREPENATKFEDSRDQSVTSFAITTEGDYVFWGFSDGRVRIQNLEYPYALENMNKHWTEGIHDCVRGKITSICLDKDGIFFITAGQDGNCFLFSRIPEKDLDAYLQREVIQPVPIAVERTDVVDIIDPAAYTLEVFKRVEKEMALLAEAKKNKAAKKEQIARLRVWYNDILKKNNELPEEVRLTPVELALTTDRESRKRDEYDAALKRLEFETAWNSEKARLSLEKVKSFYKDNVAYELFELRAFNSTENVWSFRMSNLPPWFEEAKDMVENHVTPHSVYSDTYQEEVSPTASDVVAKEPKPKRQPGMDKFQHQKLVRVWERKQRKVKRARVWKEFLKTEPKGKDLREEDRAIEEARANIGDMKLKSAPDYKVSETKKLTEHRGRKRLVILEETVYGLKSEFNELMLTLRRDKLGRLKRMNEYKTKIQESQNKLTHADIKPIPDIKPMRITENPNRTLDYTKEDIVEYKKQIEEKLKAAAPAPKTVKKQEGPAVKRKGPVGKSAGMQRRQSEIRQSEIQSVDVDQSASFSVAGFLEPTIDVPTPLEERIKRAETIKAKFWQDHYIEKINEEKLHFDAKLKLLRHRKLKLDYLIKIADQRMVLLTQEFILAQQSEALEASLESKIHNASKEKRECTNVMKVVTKKLENVKKEMDQFTRQKQVLLGEVTALATLRAPAFEKYLVRVFNKRIQKPKARLAMNPSNESIDSEDEDSSDSSDDDMDFSDDDDDGLDPDFPPPELNRDVYDSVVEIRERRGKIDDAEASTKEQLDEHQQTLNQYRTRVNVADREFEKARRELDQFHKEKQAKQNVLNCPVSMKIHQIQDLGRDLTNALVVENKSIERLMKRIPELHKEKGMQKRTGVDMKKLNLQLHSEKLMFQKRLAIMSKRCDQEMLRKFGQIRPIEELEFFTTDPRIAHLKNEIKALEESNARHINDLDLQIGEQMRAYFYETSKNTARTNTVAYITEKVHDMNKEMEIQMKKLPSELEDTVLSKEIAFMKVLLTDQWNTISSLTLEIAQLTKRNTQPLPPIKKNSNRKL